MLPGLPKLGPAEDFPRARIWAPNQAKCSQRSGFAAQFRSFTGLLLLRQPAHRTLWEINLVLLGGVFVLLA